MSSSISFQAALPSTVSEGGTQTHYPIRQAPGWVAFKRMFFVHASATVCFPKASTGMRFSVKSMGRFQLTLDGLEIMEDVRTSILLLHSACSSF
jgi:hypothetical protein